MIRRVLHVRTWKKLLQGNFSQGPLEKSMQNSEVMERQKNMDNRVAVIRSSVQVTKFSAVLIISVQTFDRLQSTYTVILTSNTMLLLSSRKSKHRSVIK